MHRSNARRGSLAGARGFFCTVALTSGFATQALSSPQPTGVKVCQEQLRSTPRSFGPYLCLAGEAGQGHRAEVEEVLRAVLRKTPDEPRALLYYALVRSLAGEHVEEEEYARAADGFRSEHNVTGLVWALTSRVGKRCFEDVHCDATTEALLIEAEGLAEQSNDTHLKRLCQLWWAREALMTDDIGREERALARLDALQGEDPPWLAVQVFETRTHLAGFLQDYRRQYELYSDLLRQGEPGSWKSAVALGGMAHAAASLAARGSFDRIQAEELLRRALAEEERSGFNLSDSDSGALATRVHLALLLGPTDEAMELLRGTLSAQTSRKGWNYPFHAGWLLARYTVERNRADVGVALAYADAEVSRAAQLGAFWEHGRGLLMRAYVLWKSGQRAAARDTALAALDEMEALRRRQADLRVRLRYEETLAFAYHLVASSLLDGPSSSPAPSDVSEAFTVMERLRARSLLETLLQGVEDSNSDLMTQTRVRIDQAQRKLLEPSTASAERMSALADLHAAERQEVALSTGPRLKASERPAPSVTDIQHALGPTEALVSFQLWKREPSINDPYAEASSWAVVITPTAAHAVRILDAGELEPETNLWLALLRRRDGSERAGGARLYAQLVEPVLGVLPKHIRQLWVIPDGALHRLPLDGLTDAKGIYLAERFGISLIPSAAVWLELKRRYVRQPGLALAMAEPAATPETEQALLSVLGLSAGAVPPLVRARQEAEWAVEAFPSGSVLLTGPRATERFLKESDLRQFSLLHLATHAVVDAAAPERSAIVLAASPDGEDGLLQVEEISHLKLEQKAVILAACSTSSGLVRRAEGVMSLARAFFEAGAQTVVGTLAPVRDAESADLFEGFYQRIAEGKSVGRALLEAKRARIHAGAPAAAWATVVALGNDEVCPRKPEARAAWALAGAGAISLLAITAFFVGLRRRLQAPRV
jgi:CHAT domain-containing protein